MALWLARAGKHGQHEARFFGDNRVYMTWNEMEESLQDAKSNDDIKAVLLRRLPDTPPARLGNWAGQIGAFRFRMNPGDLVVVPTSPRADSPPP